MDEEITFKDWLETKGGNSVHDFIETNYRKEAAKEGNLLFNDPSYFLALGNMQAFFTQNQNLRNIWNIKFSDLLSLVDDGGEIIKKDTDNDEDKETILTQLLQAIFKSEQQLHKSVKDKLESKLKLGEILPGDNKGTVISMEENDGEKSDGKGKKDLKITVTSYEADNPKIGVNKETSDHGLKIIEIKGEDDKKARIVSWNIATPGVKSAVSERKNSKVQKERIERLVNVLKKIQKEGGIDILCIQEFSGKGNTFVSRNWMSELFKRELGLNIIGLDYGRKNKEGERLQSLLTCYNGERVEYKHNKSEVGIVEFDGEARGLGAVFKFENLGRVLLTNVHLDYNNNKNGQNTWDLLDNTGKEIDISKIDLALIVGDTNNGQNQEIAEEFNKVSGNCKIVTDTENSGLTKRNEQREKGKSHDCVIVLESEEYKDKITIEQKQKGTLQKDFPEIFGGQTRGVGANTDLLRGGEEGGAPGNLQDEADVKKIMKLINGDLDSFNGTERDEGYYNVSLDDNRKLNFTEDQPKTYKLSHGNLQRIVMKVEETDIEDSEEELETVTITVAEPKKKKKVTFVTAITIDGDKKVNNFDTMSGEELLNKASSEQEICVKIERTVTTDGRVEFYVNEDAIPKGYTLYVAGCNKCSLGIEKDDNGKITYIPYQEDKNGELKKFTKDFGEFEELFEKPEKSEQPIIETLKKIKTRRPSSPIGVKKSKIEPSPGLRKRSVSSIY